MEQPPSQASAVEFTEELKGFVTVGEPDYHEGFQRGKDAGRGARVHLTVTIDDVDRFIADPTREATVTTGWVECEALGGRLPVDRGVFNLFADEAEPDRTHVYYRLFLSDGAGGPLTLSGFKDVLDDPALDRWPDTSTLYVRVFRGHTGRDSEPGAEVVAGGILHTHLADFARQLATFRARGPSSVARDRVLDDFGRLLLGRLWTVYGGQARAAAGTEGLATPSEHGAASPFGHGAGDD